MFNRSVISKSWMWAGVLLLSCATRTGGAEETRGAPASGSTGAPAKAAPIVLPPPSGAAAVYQASYDEEAAGKLEASLATLERLPATLQGAYLTELRRGWLLAKLGRNADAEKAYSRASAAEPASVEARLGALGPLMALRRWSDVETVARQILERDPGNYSASLKLAFALYSLGRFPEAEVAYRKLQGMYPGDLEVRSGVAWTLVKMGKGSEAAKAFSEILEVAPKQPLAADGLRAALAIK